MKRIFATVFVALLAIGQAHAQSWPSRPVRVIVSQAAGATPDIIARILADRLSIALGQTFFIENKPGAANAIGAQAAAVSAPDGYTLFFATAAALASNPFTFKTLPYDPKKDFTAVSMVAKGPFFILAHPGVEAKSLADLIALEKKNPGTISIATEGSRNFTGILAAWLNKKAGTHFVEIPYNNIMNGLQDAISGRVQLIALPIPSAAPLVADGKLRVLAVSSAKPTPNFLSVPPMGATLPGVELIGWFALVAPSGTPDTVIIKVNAEMSKILADKAIQTRLAELGAYTDGAGTVAETKAFLDEQYETWKNVVSEIGLDPQ